MTQDNIELRYLTWLQRELGQGSECLQLPSSVTNVDGVLDHLKSRGGRYEVFGKKHVIFANINGAIVPHTHTLGDVREITFFSPIVGG